MKNTLLVFFGILLFMTGCQKAQISESVLMTDISGTYDCVLSAGNIENAPCQVTIQTDLNEMVLDIDAHDFNGYKPVISIDVMDSQTQSIDIVPCIDCLFDAADITTGEIYKDQGKLVVIFTMKDDDWNDLIFSITEL